jgi:hypothetical protein
MLLLGLLGKAESGKSSAADAIVNRARSQGLTSRSYELSQYILQSCIDRGLIPQKTRKQLDRSEIATLVEVGESVRSRDPELWVRTALLDISADKPQVALVPNIRRQYEAEAIRREGGIILKIVSLNKNGSEFISPSRDPNNELETENLFIQSDYHLTVRRGESVLLKKYAQTLFDYLWALQPVPVDIRQTEFEFMVGQ